MSATSSTHEVIYFDGPGRAEATRILLHIAKVDFTDTRFKGPEWSTIKPTTPLGSVPVLKIDGTQYCQSIALMRYAGRLAGWYPKDDKPIDALIVDQIMDTLNELTDKFPKKTRDAKDDLDVLKKLRVEFEKTGLKQVLDFIESWIIKNGGTYCVGSTPTTADLVLMLSVKMLQKGFMDFISPTVCDSYPGIMATVAAIEANDGIKSYYESKK